MAHDVFGDPLEDGSSTFLKFSDSCGTKASAMVKPFGKVCLTYSKTQKLLHADTNLDASINRKTCASSTAASRMQKCVFIQMIYMHIYTNIYVRVPDVRV